MMNKYEEALFLAEEWKAITGQPMENVVIDVLREFVNVRQEILDIAEELELYTSLDQCYIDRIRDVIKYGRFVKYSPIFEDDE
jgi:hypothetical protein